MKLYVYIHPSAAVKAGKSLSGIHSVEITEQVLTELSEKERETLADLPGLYHQENKGLLGTLYYFDAHGQNTEPRLLAEPTIEAVVACLKLVTEDRLARAVVQSAKKAAREAGDEKHKTEYVKLVNDWFATPDEKLLTGGPELTDKSPGYQFRPHRPYCLPDESDRLPSMDDIKKKKARLQKLVDAMIEAKREKNAARFAEEKEAKDAKAEQMKTTIDAWVEEHGTASQQARYEEDLLPEKELWAAIKDHCFECLAGWPRYVKLDASDILHTEYCRWHYDEADDDLVAFDIREAESLTDEQYASLVSVREHLPNNFVTQIREHTATCGDCEKEARRYGVKATTHWHGRPFSQEYALDYVGKKEEPHDNK